VGGTQQKTQITLSLNKMLAELKQRKNAGRGKARERSSRFGSEKREISGGGVVGGVGGGGGGGDLGEQEKITLVEKVDTARKSRNQRLKEKIVAGKERGGKCQRMGHE